MTTITITCISTGTITTSGVAIQDVQTGLNAVLPAGHTVTEIYIQAIGDTSLTSNRRIAIGHENNSRQYTGSISCGISTNTLNSSDHVALTDVGGLYPSFQNAINSDQEFRIEAKCYGSIPDGQVRLVIKMKPNPPTSNTA